MLVSKSAHLSMSNSILMHNVQFGNFRLHYKTKQRQKSLRKNAFSFFKKNKVGYKQLIEVCSNIVY